MSSYFEPDHHLPTLATLYRKLFPMPALAIPLIDCTVAGQRTILLISKILV